LGILIAVTDIHIVIQGRKIEIETKAGMEFFENLGSSSNFMTQSGNSLMNVSRIEDYKVFLNPGLVVDKQAAITKVVDAWSKQGWFGKPEIMSKFGKYFDEKIDYANELEQLLRNNTNWFDDIFTKNINL
jgi:superfamily I DNA and/or RNA helicase